MTTSTERRPRRAFATLVAGAIAAAGVAAGMGSAPAAEAATTTFTFGVAQLNIKRDNSEAQQRADLAKVLPDADLVHVNEGSGAVAAIEAYNAAHDNRWHVFKGDANVNGHKEEILLARKSAFSPVTGDDTASGSKPICDLNGPGVPYPKVVNWRTYVHKASGRQLIHIGVHLPPGIDDGGRPSGKAANVACAEKAIDAVKDKAVNRAKRTGAEETEVVVTGDLNIDYEDDARVKYAQFPFVQLDEKDLASTVPSLRSNWARFGTAGYPDTFGQRKIDYVYFWKRAEGRMNLWMSSQKVVGLNSDHKAVIVSMTVRG